MSKLIMRACGFAKKAHEGQMYGDVSYYSGHLCKVADTYCKLFGEDEFGVTCCYLHDVVEDTDIEFKDIYEVFGDQVALVCLSLSRGENETYEDYLSELTGDPDACKVKYCDSLVNLQKCIDGGDWKRAEKYLNNLKYLKGFVKEFLGEM